MATAIFAAGCFWGVESAFRRLPGVTDAEVGYTGGSLANPTYEQVCGGRTGHAEAVRLTFDPSAVSYEALLDAFFGMHDPTQHNRQGPDVGHQYRSAVFALDESQDRAARDKIAALGAAGEFPLPIVTEVTAASEFWRAEEYHQRYLERQRSGGLFGGLHG